MCGHHIPIEYLVVSANPNMVMSPRFSSQPILHVSGLAERIEQLFKKHQQVHISEHDFSEFLEHMLGMHNPTQWTPNIKLNELKKGPYAHDVILSIPCVIPMENGVVVIAY